MNIPETVSPVALVNLQFQPPSIQTDIESSYAERIYPTNSLTGTNVVEFNIPGTGDYIDLYNIVVHMRVQITKADGANIDAAAEVACINYPIASMFKHVELYLNNDLVSHISDYAYKSYIETLLNYSNAAKETTLHSSLYHQDTACKMNTVGDGNLGFKDRKAYFAGSKTVEICGKLHDNLCMQPSPLVNAVSMRLIFTRQSDEFFLMSLAAGTQKLNLIDMWLELKRYSPHAEKLNAVEKMIASERLTYTVPRGEIRTVSIGKGERNFNHRRGLTTTEILPKRVVVALVDAAAFNGKRELNPFNFEHFDMSSFDIRVNSLSKFGRALQINPGTESFLEAYSSMQSLLGSRYRDGGYSIKRSEFLNGFFMFGVDLSATQADGFYEDPKESGSLEIDITFSKATPKHVIALIYTEYINTIFLNSSRRAVKDFA